MSKRADDEYLSDIREAIRRTSKYVGEISYATFTQDIKTQDAVIRNIEIIGEAARGVSEQTRVENPGVPWKSMAGMRDRLVHQYFGVNLDVVWQVITEELPELDPVLESIIEVRSRR
jgi:uncharacterized protein with HEPN domain